jgi:2-keto-4-pentenoate hydratase
MKVLSRGADVETIAAQILRYRRDGEKIPADTPRWRIDSEDDANAIQDLVVLGIADPVVGWKIGAVDAAGQKRLNLSKPFIGRVFQSRLWQSPATLCRRLLPECIPESELAFRLGRDLPARSQSYELGEVAAAIDTSHAAFEIVDFSWQDISGLQGRDFVADNGCCGGLVVGSALPDWRGREVCGEQIQLRIDGQVIRGTVGATLQVLLERTTWLTNHLSERKIGMLAGQFIATGNWTGMTPMRAGQRATAEFAGTGFVECLLPEA